MSWYVINAEYDVCNSWDYSRAIVSPLSVSFDYSRAIANSLSVSFDYSRQIGGYLSNSWDYSRQIQNYLSVSWDYSRQILGALSGKAIYTFTKSKQITKLFSENIDKFNDKRKQTKY